MSKSNPSEVKLAVPDIRWLFRAEITEFAGLRDDCSYHRNHAVLYPTTDGAYLSARNVSNLLRQTAITGILAVGMVFVIISAEIDLSVGSMMGLLGGVAAICDVWLGWPLPLTIIVTLVLGLLEPGTDGGSRTAKSLHLLSPSRACWHFVAYYWHHQRHDCFPTSAAMSQIGQSYLPASTGLSLARLA